MERKRNRGRQKISIERITKENDCFATFSKRRLGLFKKASELCTLCNIDMGVVVFSPTGKPFSFFHPFMDSVVNQLENPAQRLTDDASRLSEAFARTRIFQLNHSLDNLRNLIEAEKEREKNLTEKIKCSSNGKGWWEGPIEEFSKEQVKFLTTWLENQKIQVKNREKELKMKELLSGSNVESTSRMARNFHHFLDPLDEDIDQYHDGDLENVYMKCNI